MQFPYLGCCKMFALLAKTLGKQPKCHWCLHTVWESIYACLICRQKRCCVFLTSKFKSFSFEICSSLSFHSLINWFSGDPMRTLFSSMAEGKVNGLQIAASTFVFSCIISLGCFSIAVIISCGTAISLFLCICAGFSWSCLEVDFSKFGTGNLVRKVEK